MRTRLNKLKYSIGTYDSQKEIANLHLNSSIKSYSDFSEHQCIASHPILPFFALGARGKILLFIRNGV